MNVNNLIDHSPQPDIRSILRLSMVSGVGPRIRQALLDRFETAANVFTAAPSELRGVPGVGPKVCQAIVFAKTGIDVDAELQRCHDHNIQLVFDHEEAYPDSLRELPDPPGVIFIKGDLQPHDTMAIAIVGTRHASNYGKAQARRLASELSRAGMTIVSGLARGIDVAAHRGALEAGGRTIAVLGSGLLSIYPPEHKDLAEKIAKQGAVISELPPKQQPAKGNFPQRNRIVSGLSLGVIVVEAAERSGASITARLAAEQNREVFAVPGRVDQRTSRGCHRLLKEGACLVESVDDVLESLGPLFEAVPDADGQMVHHPAELQLNDQERKVLAAIEKDPTSIDQIVVSCGLQVSQVLATISVLEMRRLIQRVSGNLVQRP